MGCNLQVFKIILGLGDLLEFVFLKKSLFIYFLASFFRVLLYYFL